MRKTSLLLASLVFAPRLPAQMPEPAHADVASIDAIITAFYDVISGPAGQPRQWRRDSTLYIPEVRFVSMSKQGQRIVANVMDHAAFARTSDPGMVRNGFFEREIRRVTRRFGNVAQVASTYEFSSTPNGAAQGRGINYINLFWDGRRWWIANAVWDDERPDNPIPPEHLP
jgi:hypothetical protein